MEDVRHIKDVFLIEVVGRYTASGYLVEKRVRYVCSRGMKKTALTVRAAERIIRAGRLDPSHGGLTPSNGNRHVVAATWRCFYFLSCVINTTTRDRTVRMTMIIS